MGRQEHFWDASWVKKFGTFDLGHVREFWDVLGIKKLVIIFPGLSKLSWTSVRSSGHHLSSPLYYVLSL